MRAKWNFHHISIVIDKLLVKWAPASQNIQSHCSHHFDTNYVDENTHTYINNDQSTMVQVITRWYRTISHYLNQCWPISMTTWEFRHNKVDIRSSWSALVLVCSTPLLALRIGLYTASLVSLKDALIGWSASDYDAPIQLWRIQINTGYTLPSPTWRASPTWRKQKAFPLPGTAALWVF